MLARPRCWRDRTGERNVQRMFRGAEGAATLYAVKGTEKTARQYQSLLRTLTSHWKMSLGKLERGWLALLSEREYRAAVKDAAGCAASCARSSAASCTTEAAEVQECTGGEGAPSRAVLTDGCRHPLSLSEGFDERALSRRQLSTGECLGGAVP